MCRSFTLSVALPSFVILKNETTCASASGISVCEAQRTVLLAKWSVNLTSSRVVPGLTLICSRFLYAVTHGIGYSWPSMRVKCILYTVTRGSGYSLPSMRVKCILYTFTRGSGYSWRGMRVKCILYTVGYIILGRNARLYFDVKLKYLPFLALQPQPTY